MAARRTAAWILTAALAAGAAALMALAAPASMAREAAGLSGELEANIYPPLLAAPETQDADGSTATDVEELAESVRNLRVGLWATVAALGILIVSTGIAALAFLRVARQQRERR